MDGLSSVSIFQKLNPSELEQLAKIVVQEKFPADKAVFFEGDRSNVLYIVRSGSVRVYQTSLEGKEKTINTLGPGAFFGVMAMLDGQTRQAGVTANEETVLLGIGQREFRSLCNRIPEVLWKVLESLCDRIRKMDEEILDMSFRDVPYRVMRTLVRLSKEHGEQRLDGLRINIKLTPQILAGMIGANVERVSGILTKLQEDKVLRREGEYLLITDARGFEKSLEYEKDWA